jgi:molybdate transport system substrate-binding protein
LRSGWFAALLALSSATATAIEAPVRVFAASSLTDVLESLGSRFKQASGIPLQFSFASSALLARQIEAGARCDLFISADNDWMDYLQSKQQIDAASRRTVTGNRLVLVAAESSRLKLNITKGFALKAALGKAKLALADPDSVPAGRYARAALRSLGAWDDVAGQIVRADNVRSAMQFVEHGEAPLGIVYASDAYVGKGLRVVATFPTASHPAIVYPAALCNGAAQGARAFLDFLGSAEARERLRQYRFSDP